MLIFSVERIFLLYAPIGSAHGRSPSQISGLCTEVSDAGIEKTQHPCTPDVAPAYSLGRRYWHPYRGHLSTRVLLLPPAVCPILGDVGNDCL